MVSFPNAIKFGFQRYFDFSGRSTRAEYWWWLLFGFIANSILIIVDNIAGTTITPTMGIISSLFTLVIFIPGLALLFRRLHDINRSAWWLLLGFVPFGGIVIIVWMCKRGDEGENKYKSNAAIQANKLIYFNNHPGYALTRIRLTTQLRTLIAWFVVKKYTALQALPGMRLRRCWQQLRCGAGR